MGNREKEEKVIAVDNKLLLLDIHQLIQKSRQTKASFVNAKLTILYWHVGQQITHHKRAGYWKLILQTLSAKLNWDHFKDIIHIDESLKRMCSVKLFEQFTSLNQFETIEKNGWEALSYGE